MRHDAISARPVTVSATHFVRNFSMLKRAAELAPVYIEAHGKPGWALVSTAMLDALAQGGARDGLSSDAAARLDAVIDGLATRVVLIDDANRIVALNPAARLQFGVGSQVLGAPVADLVPAALGDGIDAAVERSRTSRAADVFEVDAPCERTWRITAIPVPGGAALLIDDIGDTVGVRDAHADARAIGRAVGSIGGCAIGTLTPRGAIAEADAELAALTGATPSALVGTRIGTLFDMASRARVNELVDTVFDGGNSGSAMVGLLVHGGNPCPAMIGMAPVQGRARITAARFLVIATGNRAGA